MGNSLNKKTHGMPEHQRLLCLDISTGFDSDVKENVKEILKELHSGTDPIV